MTLNLEVFRITNVEFEEERIVGIEFDCGCYFCKTDDTVHECYVHAREEMKFPDGGQSEER